MNWQYIGQLRGNLLPKEESAPSVSYGAISTTGEWLKQRNATDFYRNGCDKPIFFIVHIMQKI